MVKSFSTELSSAAACFIVADVTSAGCIKLHWRKKKLEVDKFSQIWSSVVV